MFLIVLGYCSHTFAVLAHVLQLNLFFCCFEVHKPSTLPRLSSKLGSGMYSPAKNLARKKHLTSSSSASGHMSCDQEKHVAPDAARTSSG
jgi:hypothetical protein